MSRFILAILLVPFAPVTILADDESAIVETVKSQIPQTLDAPKTPRPKPEDKTSTKTSGAKKKSKKR